MKVLRITCHPADQARIDFLKKIFGSNVQVVDNDIEYGSDPVQAVCKAIEKAGDVVAVELIAPPTVYSQILPHAQKQGIKLLRAEFIRDTNGRAKVIGKDDQGRDVLAFERYVELVRLAIETKELT